MLALRVVAWLVLISVAMTAGIVNIVKYATRATPAKCWLDSKSEQAEKLAQQMNTESGDRLNEDQQKLTWLILEAGERKPAHDAASLVLPLRPKSDGYDDAYARRLHLVAVSELMDDCSEDMLITLFHTLDYDRRHLPANDARLARDYNNIGLGCFLVGQDSPYDDFRHRMLKQSAAWLDKAEACMPQDSLTGRVSIWENRLMLAEAQRDRRLADDYRHKIDVVLARINGPVPRVALD